MNPSMNLTKNKLILTTGSTLVLLAIQNVYAGDYSPTSAVRPSPGLINEWFRKDDPYRAAWDIGVNSRFRYEVKEHFAIAGTAGSLDFRDHGADVYNAYFLDRIKPRVGYSAEWWSIFVEGRHSDTTGDNRNPNPESDGA